MELIEAQIEKVVIDKLETALHNFGDIRIVGTWQPSEEDDELKGEEEAKDTAILGVKVFPRSYDTPTIPYAEIQAQVSLAVRADADFNGRDYLAITAAISDVLQEWQNTFASLDDFNLEHAFTVTGFNLTGGDCGQDRGNCIWQFSQGFSIYGIVEKETSTSVDEPTDND